jgi:hypothetical protein
MYITTAWLCSNQNMHLKTPSFPYQQFPASYPSIFPSNTASIEFQRQNSRKKGSGYSPLIPRDPPPTLEFSTIGGPCKLKPMKTI